MGRLLEFAAVSKARFLRRRLLEAGCRPLRGSADSIVETRGMPGCAGAGRNTRCRPDWLRVVRLRLSRPPVLVAC
jgi:hypothetical protein